MTSEATRQNRQQRQSPTEGPGSVRTSEAAISFNMGSGRRTPMDPELVNFGWSE